MEKQVAVRTVGLEAAETLLDLQRQAPGAAAWSQADYESLLSDGGAHCWLAHDELWDRPAGFLLGRSTGDEMEILNLAVAPAYRRCGIARRLVGQALAQARAAGAGQCWLEVRSSNQAALAFYRAAGFSEAYRRRQYYRDPADDAVVCTRRLDDGSGPVLPSLGDPDN